MLGVKRAPSPDYIWKITVFLTSILVQYFPFSFLDSHLLSSPGWKGSSFYFQCRSTKYLNVFKRMHVEITTLKGNPF